MKGILVAAFAFLLSTVCLAQLATPDEGAVVKILNHVERACADRNAGEYVSAFNADTAFDGPFGQNAIGPQNAVPSIRQMFAIYGALRTTLAVSKHASPDVIVTDIYQRRLGSPVERQIPPDGSVMSPGKATLRTTIIFRVAGGSWKIMSIRVADVHAYPQRGQVALK